MTEPIIRTAFAPLSDERRFCAWKLIQRDGKQTKFPIVDSGSAKSNDHSTWMEFEPAVELSKREGIAGLGIFLGPLIQDPNTMLIGTDLDTCRDPETGELTCWAAELVNATPMYWEVSPSKTGLKGFALIRKVDLEAFSASLNQRLSRTWKKAGATGDHPPCIDLYAQGRFFTITGHRIDETEGVLSTLTQEQIGRVINEFGPKLAGKPNRHKRTSPTVRTPEAPNQESTADREEGAECLEQNPLERMREWAASSDMLPYRQASELLMHGNADHLPDSSRSAQEFAFARVARLAGLNERDYRRAIQTWTEEGIGYGGGDGDDRSDYRRDRDWSRCWKKQPGVKLPIYVSDRERNALFIQKTDNGQRYYEKLSSYIHPMYELTDDAGEHFRCFEIGTRIDKFKQVIIPCRAWSGRRDDFIDALTREGLFHANYRSSRSDLRSWVNSGKPPSATLVTRTGWVSESAFVMPGKVIRADEGPEVIESIPVADGFGSRGTLEDWQRMVSKHCQGNSRLIIALCAAFLGPLLKWTGTESGGLHINGPSSTGKTTALRLIASVYGPPSFMKTWRATDNGLEGVAESRSDTCLLLDELSEAAPGAADRIVYMLANQRGKDRANRDGSSRPARQWRIIFVSCGEISLSGKLREIRKLATAGQQVRVLNISADAGANLGLFDTIHGHESPSIFAEKLASAASKSYGTAGPSFIEKFINNREQVLTWFEEAKASFFEANQAERDDGQVRRALSRFSALAAAGEVAIRLEVLPLDSGEAIWGVSRCFDDWIKNRGHNGPVEEQRCIELVKRHIETRGKLDFWPLDPEESVRNVSERAGFVKTEDGGPTTYYYLSQPWNKMFEAAGLNPRTASKILGRRNHLKRGDGNRWQVKMDLSNHELSPHQRVYAVSSSILDEE